jgi:transposase
VVTHEALTPGAPCPHCCEGTLYRQNDWSQVVRLIGQPPVGGQRYELERLRCGLCGKMETAPLPEQAGPSKYGPSVASMIAALRYGEGLPWTRIERLQLAAGIPLPASVQWELVRDAIDRGVGVAYRQLLYEAAQGSLMHNDDTHMRILELTVKLNKGEPLRDDQPDRRGVFTTNIVWFRQACATQDFFCAQGRAAPGRVTEWEATARRFSLAGRAESAPPMSEGRRARGC